MPEYACKNFISEIHNNPLDKTFILKNGVSPVALIVNPELNESDVEAIRKAVSLSSDYYKNRNKHTTEEEAIYILTQEINLYLYLQYKKHLAVISMLFMKKYAN
jgi:hypothetical protein